MATTAVTDIPAAVKELGIKAKKASRKLVSLSPTQKNDALFRMAELLSERADSIIAANANDLKAGEEKGLTAAMLDRLKLTRERLDDLGGAVRAIAAQNDPVGEVTGMWRQKDGLLVGKVRIPLGVVMMVYESRPNVTVDAAALCLKAGNACILRGGSEAFHSNQALAAVVQDALEATGLPRDAVQVVPFTDREGVLELLKLEDYIDLAIPRGGEKLIRFVAENARIPVIKHYKGVCHVYVDEAADLETAAAIAVNGKVQRPGVCNALETLLVHEAVAADFLPKLAEAMPTVEIRGDEAVRQHIPSATAATDEDWDAEYLDLILAVRVVDSFDAALDHIAAHGSQHTEAIVTKDYAKSQRFLREVDASCVIINASTRFNDGGQLGLGAEIGISTTKLHAFGPMGATELTAQKFIIYGEGQVRG